MRVLSNFADFAGTEMININSDPDWVLRRLDGLSEVTAEAILAQRGKKPFKNAKHVRKRLKLGNSKALDDWLSVIVF